MWVTMLHQQGSSSALCQTAENVTNTGALRAVCRYSWTAWKFWLFLWKCDSSFLLCFLSFTRATYQVDHMWNILIPRVISREIFVLPQSFYPPFSLTVFSFDLCFVGNGAKDRKCWVEAWRWLPLWDGKLEKWVRGLKHTAGVKKKGLPYSK